MYSRQEASQLRQAFWTTFGQYMAPITSAEGDKVSWVNYKTGIKHLYFRMQAGNKSASIAIEISHPDTELQQWYYEELIKFKKLFRTFVEEEWQWLLHTTDEQDKVVSRIFTEQAGISVFRKEDWPALISFFKSRIIALDAFWHAVKYHFKMMQ